MPQSLASVYLHVVFSTKNRAPFITPELCPRLYQYLSATALGNGTMILSIGGMPDHVHLLLSFGRDVKISDTVKTLKGSSSRWVHETYANMAYFAWQAGYGAFSVSFSKIGHVKDYIAKQEAHHRKKSFQDEFREYLRAHELEWDERYVWD